MTELLAHQIRLETGIPCHIASQNLQPEVGHIYLAPSDYHLVINPPPVSLGLNQKPKANFMRPSADALFESAGKVFGEFCAAVIYPAWVVMEPGARELLRLGLKLSL